MHRAEERNHTLILRISCTSKVCAPFLAPGRCVLQHSHKPQNLSALVACCTGLPKKAAWTLTLISLVEKKIPQPNSVHLSSLTLHWNLVQHPPKANGRWISRVLPSQQRTPHRWAQREAWGRRSCSGGWGRWMISSYTLFGHIPKLSGALAYCWWRQVWCEETWMAVASAALAGVWITTSSHTSRSSECGGTSQCFYKKPVRTVLVTWLSWGICPQKVQSHMLPSTRQWESGQATGAAGQALPLHQSQGTSKVFPCLPRRTPQSLTPPTGLSKQPPPFQMLMLFSWLDCGTDHELGVNHYSLSMLIYTHWEFPFLHHLAELYDMSFISPHSLACRSPFLAPEPPALLWTPCRFAG